MKHRESSNACILHFRKQFNLTNKTRGVFMILIAVHVFVNAFSMDPGRVLPIIMPSIAIGAWHSHPPRAIDINFRQKKKQFQWRWLLIGANEDSKVLEGRLRLASRPGAYLGTERWRFIRGKCTSHVIRFNYAYAYNPYNISKKVRVCSHIFLDMYTDKCINIYIYIYVNIYIYIYIW